MIIVHLLLSVLAISIASYLVPGVTLVGGVVTAVVLAVVLGIINVFIKPVLLILTLPVNILTLGLFSFVLNALLVLLAAAIVPGFQVAGFVPALIFSVVLSLINILFGMLNAKK